MGRQASPQLPVWARFGLGFFLLSYSVRWYSRMSWCSFRRRSCTTRTFVSINHTLDISRGLCLRLCTSMGLYESDRSFDLRDTRSSKNLRFASRMKIKRKSQRDFSMQFIDCDHSASNGCKERASKQDMRRCIINAAKDFVRSTKLRPEGNEFDTGPPSLGVLFLMKSEWRSTYLSRGVIPRVGLPYPYTRLS